MPSEKILTAKQAYVAELKEKIANSVAGVVVAIAAMLKMNPLELVKRASVPCVIGLLVHHVSVFWLAL